MLGNLDIAEHRLPQDGQFTIELAGNAVSFRIATLACRGGEKVVFCLLYTSFAGFSKQLVDQILSTLNTFFTDDQPEYPGNLELERRIRSAIRCV